LSVALPAGYSYDCVNRDGLLHLAEVREGQLLFDGGGRYRVLVLPGDVLLTPEIAGRLRELVHAGAVVVGPRPLRSPSMMGFPHADATVARVARELWGEGGGGPVDRRVGKGRVVWGVPLGQLLSAAGAPPDVEIEVGHDRLRTQAQAGEANLPVLWTHRAGPGWDLYFLSNQDNTSLTVTVTFRVAGRRPELWHPDTGEIEKLALWREETGRTVVRLTFDPAGSLFILFAQPGAADQPFLTAISGANSDAVRLSERDGRAEAVVALEGSWTVKDSRGVTHDLKVSEFPEPLVLAGPWSVRFADNVDKPVDLTLHTLSSWADHAEPAVKYYSGTARYTTEFTLSVPPDNYRVFLELGEVHDLVEIQVNDQHVAILWKPPFTVDITRAVRAGNNKLVLRVTNTWRNRLIGDFGKPDAERKTFVVPSLRLGKQWLPGGPGTVLSPAGLLGPVRVRYEAVVSIG
jgi:hypothetical protein